MKRLVFCPCLHGKLTPEVHCVPKSSSSKGCLFLLTIPMLLGPGETGEGAGEEAVGFPMLSPLSAWPEQSRAAASASLCKPWTAL